MDVNDGKKIVNIMGKKGAGKTYAAGELAKYLLNEGYSVYMDAFGTELKKMVMRFFGISKTSFDKAVIDRKELKERIKRLYMDVYKNKNAKFAGSKKEKDNSDNLEKIKKIYNSDAEKDLESIYEYIHNKDIRGMLQYTGTEIIRKIDPGFFSDALEYKLKKLKDNVDCVIISDCRFINEYETLNSQFFNTKNFYIETDEQNETDTHISEMEINKIMKIYKDEIIVIKNDKNKIFDASRFDLTNIAEKSPS